MYSSGVNKVSPNYLLDGDLIIRHLKGVIHFSWEDQGHVDRKRLPARIGYLRMVRVSLKEQVNIFGRPSESHARMLILQLQEILSRLFTVLLSICFLQKLVRKCELIFNSV